MIGLSFQTLYQEAQSQAQDTATDSLILLKRAINQGMRKFMALLNREWIDGERTFSIVASQQYYQMPEDSIRLKSLTVTVGSITYPLIEVADDLAWQELNMRVIKSSIPRRYYVKANDQFGIWPVPSGDLSGAGTLTFEQEAKDMSQDDYTTGTIAVTNGSTAVVGSGTAFTANMVGRSLGVTDSNPDGAIYKIASFTDTTHITLENDYGGNTNGGASYMIGEFPNIPSEFHESLVDYALWRYYRRRRDFGSAKEMKAVFDESLMFCEQNYSSKTASQYMRASGVAGPLVYANDRSFNQTRSITP
jgi:hypothetical protein